NFVQTLRLELAHVARNPWETPARDVQGREDFAGAAAAHRFDIVDAPEAMLVGHGRHHAQKPGKAVGQRAVEIEDDELIGHSFETPARGALPMLNAWARRTPPRQTQVHVRRP